MKSLLISLALLIPGLARADLNDALARLNSAEQQLQSAQAQLQAAQSRIVGAQNTIEQSKQDILAAMQPRGPFYVCVYNFNAFQSGQKQYTGRGATQEEATQNTLFNCQRDTSNAYTAYCKDWEGTNGGINCRAVNN